MMVSISFSARMLGAQSLAPRRQQVVQTLISCKGGMARRCGRGKCVYGTIAMVFMGVALRELKKGSGRCMMLSVDLPA